MSPGGRDRMARAGAEFAERMQLGRPRNAEEAVPNLRSEGDNAGQPTFEIAEPDRAQKIGHVGA